MSAKYLIRFDDICPTMNWEVWSQIEALLDKYSIKPILAVVPDNHDPQLMVAPAMEDFWVRVRDWQSKGWTIGLHGFQHRYETNDAGLIGLNERSEFAGLSEAVQSERIKSGIAIMKDQGIVPSVWIAPGHSFDQTTIDSLLENDIAVLSDGFFVRPVVHLGALWIPQQLWRFRPIPFGIWTVCYHHNSFGAEHLQSLELDILRYRSQIVAINEVLASQPFRAISTSDKLSAMLWLRVVKAKQWLRAWT